MVVEEQQLEASEEVPKRLVEAVQQLLWGWLRWPRQLFVAQLRFERLVSALRP